MRKQIERPDRRERTESEGESQREREGGGEREGKRAREKESERASERVRERGARKHLGRQRRRVDGPRVEVDEPRAVCRAAAGHRPAADGAGDGVADDGPAEEAGVPGDRWFYICIIKLNTGNNICEKRY